MTTIPGDAVNVINVSSPVPLSPLDVAELKPVYETLVVQSGARETVDQLMSRHMSDILECVNRVVAKFAAGDIERDATGAITFVRAATRFTRGVSNEVKRQWMDRLDRGEPVFDLSADELHVTAWEILKPFTRDMWPLFSTLVAGGYLGREHIGQHMSDEGRQLMIDSHDEYELEQERVLQERQLADNQRDIAHALEVATLQSYVRERGRQAARDRIRQEESVDLGGGWVDIADLLDGELEVPQPPSVLRFSDDPDVGLLYPGRYNTLFGVEGTGKSLLLAAVQANYINREQHVVHLEFDNNPAAHVVHRIINAGADPKLVRQYMHILVNESSVPPFDFEPGFVSLDSMNAAITALDEDPNSSSRGIDLVIKTFIQPFTELGATALSLDHVGWSDTDRTSNNRRKVQAVQGLMLRIELEGQPGRVGQRWLSRLTLVKDNPGHAHVARGQCFGYVVYDGQRGDGTCDVSLWKTPLADIAAAEFGMQSTGERVRTDLLQILHEMYPERLTVSEAVRRINDERIPSVGDAGQVNTRAVQRALTALKENGLVDSVSSQSSQRATQYWRLTEAGLASVEVGIGGE